MQDSGFQQFRVIFKTWFNLRNRKPKIKNFYWGGPKGERGDPNIILWFFSENQALVWLLATDIGADLELTLVPLGPHVLFRMGKALKNTFRRTPEGVSVKQTTICWSTVHFLSLTTKQDFGFLVEQLVKRIHPTWGVQIHRSIVDLITTFDTAKSCSDP